MAQAMISGGGKGTRMKKVPQLNKAFPGTVKKSASGNSTAKKVLGAAAKAALTGTAAGAAADAISAAAKAVKKAKAAGNTSTGKTTTKKATATPKAALPVKRYPQPKLMDAATKKIKRK